MGEALVPWSFRGIPYEVGLAHGRAVRASIRDNCEAYLEGLARAGLLDTAALRDASARWLEAVPGHYREEMAGLARGAEVDLAELADWLYGPAYAGPGCTSVVTVIDGRAWIAHNNDWHDFGSHRWTAAIVRDVQGRIPHLTFGLQGDVCAVVGVNRERLWLNAHGFAASDAPRPGAPTIPYVFLVREALETCGSLDEVESLIASGNRDAPMAVYAVDGKTESSAVFECGLGASRRRDPVAEATLVSASCDPERRQIIGDGHAPLSASIIGSNSRGRIDRLTASLALTDLTDLPTDLIHIMADPAVEDETGTIYSNVACPALGLVWFGCGALPAASAGTWHRVAWPWG